MAARATCPAHHADDAMGHTATALAPAAAPATPPPPPVRHRWAYSMANNRVAVVAKPCGIPQRDGAMSPSSLTP